MKRRGVKLLSMLSVICFVLIGLLLYQTQAQQPKPGKEREVEVEIGADGKVDAQFTINRDVIFNGKATFNQDVFANAKVGIGTTSPGATLDINGNIRIPNNQSIAGNSWNGIGYLDIAKVGGLGNELIIGDGNNHNLHFVTGGTAGATSMFIANGGNIGIGTTAPEAKLDVAGTIFVSDNLTIGTKATGPGMEDLVLHKDKAGGFTQIVSRNTNSSGYAELVVNCPSQNTGSAAAPMARFGGDWTGISQAGNPLAGNTLFAAGGVHTSFIFNPGIDYRFEIGPAEVMRIAQSGNVGIGTTNPNHPLEMASGAHVTAGGVWTNASDRNLKENFVPVDGKALLEKIDQLPISMWNYKAEGVAVKHIGPTAQDFQAIFGLGSDDKTISTIDPAGVALAAIQELKKQKDSLAAENQALAAKNEELSARLAKLEAAVESLMEK